MVVKLHSISDVDADLVDTEALLNILEISASWLYELMHYGQVYPRFIEDVDGICICVWNLSECSEASNKLKLSEGPVLPVHT